MGFLFISTLLYSQSKPKLIFLKNGKEVKENDFSYKKNDVLEVQILNDNKNISYNFACIELLVIPSPMYQETRRIQEDWKKHCKSKFQTSKDFSQSPKLKLEHKSIYNKESTRLIVTILRIYEKDNNLYGSGMVKATDKFTLSKEYSFWNENGPAQ